MITAKLTTLNNKLCTIEKSGALYETDLVAALWKQIGKPEFGNTVLLLSGSAKLHTIESSGSFYEVNIR